jgi:glucose/arabinose dehydrogenase
MRHSGLRWEPASLDRYLASPSGVVSGTYMPVHVADADIRRDLIAYLETLHGAAPASVTEPGSTPSQGPAAEAGATLTGGAAFGDWHGDAPGVRRRITVADLPPPFATASAGNSPDVIDRPAGAIPHAPPGFHVDLFADGLEGPRLMRVAPNGDLFVSETDAGRVLVLRAGESATAGKSGAAHRQVFAEGLDGPFGIAFYPAGPNPQWVYVAANNRVMRFAYRNGDMQARGEPEVIVPSLAASTGGHVTRDIAFSPDGSRMFVSVGSGSNVAEEMRRQGPQAIRDWEASRRLGAAWGYEANRADVLAFTPDGKQESIFATGLRNCVGLAVQPGSGALWCSTNERDGLGDDLVPDYVTRVREGAFYGWPWYYLGDNEEPRLAGQRPDLKGHVSVPDVLIQPHSASLEMTFYDASAFPAAYRGAFAAEHGSWNRAKRTGYKVIRIVLDAQGRPTGEYQDFLTGFVVNNDAVWGRPVGVAVASDGALLVSEDANGTIWRVSYNR